MALTYGTVTGRFNDMDNISGSVSGNVHFIPEVDYLLSDDATILLPSPVTVPLTNEAFSVSLLATDDPSLNPVDWSYKVIFELMVMNRPFKREGFSIKVPAGVVTDLATVTPVAAYEGSPTIVGPQGIQGERGLTGPQGIQGLQGIQGVKGDPGGWAASTVLTAGTNLDTVITSGLYLNPQANAAAGPSNSTNGGHLEVIASANWIYQRYTPISDHRETYVRHRTSSSAWSAWAVHNTTRVDQTAGRAIYQWDDLNNREQLIYGDTGWRSVAITVVANSTVSGNVRYRRIGSTVYLRFVDVILATGSGYCPIITAAEVPVGFRPNSNERSQQSIGLGNNALAMQVISIFGEIAWSKTIDTTVSTTRPTVALVGTVQWVTDETWPTVLPGTASGTIPNA